MLQLYIDRHFLLFPLIENVALFFILFFQLCLYLLMLDSKQKSCIAKAMGKDIPWFGEAWATRTTVRFQIISCFSCFSILFLSSQGVVIQGTWSEYPEWSHPRNTRELLSFKSFVSNLTFLILSTILYAVFIIYFSLYSIMRNKSVINWKFNAHRWKDHMWHVETLTVETWNSFWQLKFHVLGLLSLTWCLLT